MDPIKTIGQILSDKEDRRDAIHIAIMPVICDEDCYAGDAVMFVYGSRELVKRTQEGQDSIGLIDPFLKKDHFRIPKGSKVWMFLHPGTVTGMRHQWIHPEVDTPVIIKGESETWLRRFADKWNFDYNQMVSEAQEDGGYVVARGKDLHSASELEPGDESAFWHHLECLTGKQFEIEHREKFGWSCSC